MITEINHVGIRNRDMERTLAYYAALDAQIVFDEMIPGPQIRIVYLQLGDGLVEFIGPPAGAEADTSHGIDHLAFLTDDIDADHARLLAAGAIEQVAPKTAGTGVGRISFVQLGDARLELLERDVEFRLPPLEHSLVTALDHYSLTTPDIDATASFFTDVLGLEPRGGIDAGGTAIRRYLGLGADAVGLGVRGTEAGPGVFPSITLRVADVDTALAELRRRGLTGLGPATESRTGSGGHALIEDPDGVPLELVDRSPLGGGEGGAA